MTIAYPIMALAGLVAAVYLLTRPRGTYVNESTRRRIAGARDEAARVSAQLEHSPRKRRLKDQSPRASLRALWRAWGED